MRVKKKSPSNACTSSCLVLCLNIHSPKVVVFVQFGCVLRNSRIVRHVLMLLCVVLPDVLCCSLVSSKIAKLYTMCNGAVLCDVLCLSVVFCGVLICREMEELSDVDGPIIRSGEAQQCDKFSKLFYCHHHHPHPHHRHHYSY